MEAKECLIEDDEQMEEDDEEEKEEEKEEEIEKMRTQTFIIRGESCWFDLKLPSFSQTKLFRLKRLAKLPNSHPFRKLKRCSNSHPFSAQTACETPKLPSFSPQN